MTSCRWMTLALFGVLASGCVSVADFERVRREQREMQARLADTQATVDSLKQRVDSMRTSLDESSRRAGSGRSPAVTDLERRVALLEQREATLPPSAPQTPEIPGAPVAPAVVQLPRTPAADVALKKEDVLLASGTLNDTYRAGLEKYRAGDCDQAMASFRQFIRSQPTSDLADNAQYWIGECYYARKDYNRAIIELNEVFTKYPKGDRVPGALLALATAFADSGDDIDARLILQKLINDHPRTEESELGKQKLKTLTQ